MPVLGGDDEEFAQVLAGGAEVVASTPGLSGSLLTPDDYATVTAEGRLVTEREVTIPGEDEPEQSRLLALRAGERVVVAGGSLEDRAEALEGLLAQLFVVGPAALLLAAAAGYLLGGARSASGGGDAAAVPPRSAPRPRASDFRCRTRGTRSAGWGRR